MAQDTPAGTGPCRSERIIRRPRSRPLPAPTSSTEPGRAGDSWSTSRCTSAKPTLSYYRASASAASLYAALLTMSRDRPPTVSLLIERSLRHRINP